MLFAGGRLAGDRSRGSGPARVGSRTVGLDALRLVAAAMVFVHHLLPYVVPGRVTTGFDVGVMIFFALSGYLLYRPFVESKPAVWGYVVRRVARIYPGFIVAAVGLGLLTHEAPAKDPLALLAMSGTPIAVAWTLKIELAFYMMLPLLAVAIRGLTLRPRLVFLAGCGAVCLGWGAISGITTGVATGYAAWAFVPGMVVAELARARPIQRSQRIVMAAVGIALIGTSIALELPFPDIPGGLGAALVLPWFVHWNPARGARLIVLGGAMSYAIYLWHLPLVVALGLGAVPTTLAVAAASYLIVEKPFIRAGKVVGARLDDLIERRVLTREGRDTRRPRLMWFSDARRTMPAELEAVPIRSE